MSRRVAHKVSRCLGRLTLTGDGREKLSPTNVVLQIMTVAGTHWIITVIRARWPRMARILDGTPLVLLESDYWRTTDLAPEGHLARLADGNLSIQGGARFPDLRSLRSIVEAINNLVYVAMHEAPPGSGSLLLESG